MKNLKIIGYILAAITLLAMTYSWLATGIMLFIDFIWFTVVVKKSPVPSKEEKIPDFVDIANPLSEEYYQAYYNK